MRRHRTGHSAIAQLFLLFKAVGAAVEPPIGIEGRTEFIPFNSCRLRRWRQSRTAGLPWPPEASEQAFDQIAASVNEGTLTLGPVQHAPADLLTKPLIHLTQCGQKKSPQANYATCANQMLVQQTIRVSDPLATKRAERPRVWIRGRQSPAPSRSQWPVRVSLPPTCGARCADTALSRRS